MASDFQSLSKNIYDTEPKKNKADNNSQDQYEKDLCEKRC